MRKVKLIFNCYRIILLLIRVIQQLQKMRGIEADLKVVTDAKLILNDIDSWKEKRSSRQSNQKDIILELLKNLK